MSVGDDYVFPRGLESQAVKGDIVTDMHTHQELQCLQCFADLTKGGHLGTCSHSVMQGDGALWHREWGYRLVDPDDLRFGEWTPVMGDPHLDLLMLCATVESSARVAIDQLDGGPEGGYGPRIWLRYWRKKRALREMRHLESEAQLIRSTTARLP